MEPFTHAEITDHDQNGHFQSGELKKIPNPGDFDPRIN
jgi:hypothetical protein